MRICQCSRRACCVAKRFTVTRDFSVGIPDRTHLVYREGSKKMTLAGELLMNGFVFYLATIGPWDDATAIDEGKRPK